MVAAYKLAESEYQNVSFQSREIVGLMPPEYTLEMPFSLWRFGRGHAI